MALQRVLRLSPTLRRSSGRLACARWVRAASSGPSKGQDDDQPKDAFSSGLPFLFRNNATVPTLVTLLALIYAYNAYSDYSDAQVCHTAPEQELDADVVKVLADGRVLMRDGSIQRR